MFRWLHNESANAQQQLKLASSFTLFTIIALWIDSVFTTHYFDARQVTNVLAIGYFALLFRVSGVELRKLMLVMVVLSYIGELIFCKLLDMYAYRTSAIPLYVPFGHAIVYASGYILAHTRWAIYHENGLRKFFALFFIVLFLSVGFFSMTGFRLSLVLCFLYF
jgi:hypothetical protein